MMDRRHFEQPLPVGELEVAYLDHDRQAGAHGGQAEQQHREGAARKHAHAHHHAADEHAACVPHKDLRGIMVELQEPDDRAAQGCAACQQHGPDRHRQAGLGIQEIAEDAEGSHADGGHGGQQAVQSVLQVGAVGHEHHQHRHHRHIEDAQVPGLVGKGQQDLCAHEIPAVKRKNHPDDQLHEQFLLG